jgi:hypothetical protein
MAVPVREAGTGPRRDLSVWQAVGIVGSAGSLASVDRE